MQKQDVKTSVLVPWICEKRFKKCRENLGGTSKNGYKTETFSGKNLSETWKIGRNTKKPETENLNFSQMTVAKFGEWAYNYHIVSRW